MEVLNGFFDKLEGKTMYLNCNLNKSIRVLVDPENLPDVRLVYKLYDHNHNSQVTFSIETMNSITEICDKIDCNFEKHKEILVINSELKVFSEIRHNKCTVCFLSSQGVKINMSFDTFNRLVCSSPELLEMYNKVRHKVCNTLTNLIQLFDVLLVKYAQCHVNNPEFKDFLQQLQQNVCSFVQEDFSLTDTSIECLNDSDDSDIGDEDEVEDELFEDSDKF